MKKICEILLVFLFVVFLCGCRRVALCKADELTMRSWSAETKAGLRSVLEFCENTAIIRVFDEKGGLLTEVDGVFSADENYLSITDDELCKTYIIRYKVFSDRAELEYLGKSVTFYPVVQQETTPYEIEKTE